MVSKPETLCFFKVARVFAGLGSSSLKPFCNWIIMVHFCKITHFSIALEARAGYLNKYCISAVVNPLTSQSYDYISFTGELTSDELPYSEYFWEIARMIRYSFFSEVGALPAVYEISREAYEGLQLLFAISPTQKTIEAIVKHDPNFTVGQLFMDLSYMGRLDVIKAISPNYECKKIIL